MDAIFVGSYFENFIALKLGDLIGDVFDRKPDVMSIDPEREPEWRKSKLTCDFQPNPFQISTQGKIFSDKIQLL